MLDTTVINHAKASAPFCPKAYLKVANTRANPVHPGMHSDSLFGASWTAKLSPCLFPTCPKPLASISSPLPPQLPPFPLLLMQLPCCCLVLAAAAAAAAALAASMAAKAGKALLVLAFPAEAALVRAAFWRETWPSFSDYMSPGRKDIPKGLGNKETGKKRRKARQGRQEQRRKSRPGRRP
eukprot:1142017-Pelagomonas_calceolata.AAC.4